MHVIHSLDKWGKHNFSLFPDQANLCNHEVKDNLKESMNAHLIQPQTIEVPCSGQKRALLNETQEIIIVLTTRPIMMMKSCMSKQWQKSFFYILGELDAFMAKIQIYMMFCRLLKTHC